MEQTMTLRGCCGWSLVELIAKLPAVVGIAEDFTSIDT
jgi:hypothetical protein